MESGFSLVEMLVVLGCLCLGALVAVVALDPDSAVAVIAEVLTP